MEPTIKCGKHLAKCANLAGSRFEDVNLGGAEFDDINLAQSKFHNINLSDATLTAAQIGGMTLRHIGLPPGSTEKQRPLKIEEADLNSSTIQRCNLADLKIEDCNIEGMTIDGIPVAQLISEYKKNH